MRSMKSLFPFNPFLDSGYARAMVIKSRDKRQRSSNVISTVNHSEFNIEISEKTSLYALKFRRSDTV
jgi:hypothetical protein